MRILATLLSVLMTISVVNAIGTDWNSKPRRPWNVWTTQAHVKPARGCPSNRVQLDGKLHVNRTLKTTGVFQVSQSRPDLSFLPNGWASITPRDKCTVFVFEIDVKEAFGKTCNLVFDLPAEKDAPGYYRSVGPNRFTFQYFSPLAPPPTANVTWNSLPPLAAHPQLVLKDLFPWSSYVMESMPCYSPLGNTDKIVRSGMMCSPHTNFQFKQGITRCPLGLFIVMTDPFLDG